MNVEDISRVLAKKKSSTAVKMVWIRNKEGQLNKVPRSEVESLGHFESKQGSTRRSRKGRTYVAPNGYARYVPNQETEVVSYGL